MEQGTKYSVIVVCLNAGQRLCETVKSILGQTYRNFEVVIKDGGSTDGSVEALASAYQDTPTLSGGARKSGSRTASATSTGPSNTARRKPHAIAPGSRSRSSASEAGECGNRLLRTI